MFTVCVLLLYLVAQVASKTIHFDFNITTVLANPDGLHERPVIGLNGQWPPPMIEASVGDVIVINARNLLLPDQPISLHFHGISMKGTPHMDGASQVSQCGILPGKEFEYIFQVPDPGTYWYHAHDHAQIANGLRGLLIVRDPEPPYASDYDEEIFLSVSDWFHDPVSDLLSRSSDENSMSTAPVPDAILLNDRHELHINAGSGKKYLVRLVNIGASTGHYFHIADHELTVVEVDGVYTKHTTTEGLHLAPGQRYSFLMNAKNESKRGYRIIITPDLEVVTSSTTIATGWIEYGTAASADENETGPTHFQPADILDDVSLMPLDGHPVLDPPSRTITLEVNMYTSEDGTESLAFNNSQYTGSDVPTLYTALATKRKSVDPAIYSPSINPFVLEQDEVVELVINNHLPTRQTFHLHGQKFQIVYRSKAGAGPFLHGEDQEGNHPLSPVRRDTIMVNGGGSVVLRFKADNPGVWLLESPTSQSWPSRLAATFIVSPLELQRTLSLSSIPIPFADACTEDGVSLIMATPLPVEGLRTPADSIKDGLIYPLIYLVVFGAALPTTAVLLWPGIRWCAEGLVVKVYGIGAYRPVMDRSLMEKLP
ncbi:Cupredoxin [Aspergillus heterothallicus]